MSHTFETYLTKIEKELKNAIPESFSKSWNENSFGILSETINEGHLEPLKKPTLSLINLGGKRWRPLLLVLISQAFNPSEEITENAYKLTPVVEFTHTASLLHDDIEDKSTERRGKPAGYLTYGLDVTLNAGSWLYFQAAECINHLSLDEHTKLKLYQCYMTELRRLHLGQAMDIKWHNDKLYIPSIDEYLTMVKSKTGTLSCLATKIGATVAGASEQNIQLTGTIAANIGAGFQILDDVTNLTTGNPGKKRGDDLVEMKRSLPVILFAQKNKSNKENVQKLLDYMKKASENGIEDPSVEEAISLLSESNVIQEAKELGFKFIQEGLEGFNKLFGEDNIYNQMISQLFNKMFNK